MERCLHAICNISILIQNLSIGLLLNRCLAELPTIIDRFFTGLVNTTSGYVQVESDGSHKWHPKSLSKLKIPKCIPSVDATF